MEAKTRLHPLLTAAAISVTIFSAAGVASLTGLLPTSIGAQKQEAALQPAQEAFTADEPAVTAPAPAPVTAKPQVQQKNKMPARVAAKPRPSTPVAYNDFQTQARKPVLQPGHLATIQAVREVKQPGQHTGLGPIAGGIAGAVLGDRIGKGKDTTRKVLTVLGAAGGAYAGREIEKQARATTHWEVDLRRDDGAYETVRSEVAPPWQPGERVRIVDGRLQPA